MRNVLMLLFGSKDIKVRVKNFIETEKKIFSGKLVIDLPAGSGETSELLYKIGANVRPYDLFPEFFKYRHLNLQCEYCDLNSKQLAIPEKSADVIFCQEGIEHIADQYQLFKNFNKILKEKGVLYITTPNLSNMRGKFSFLIQESEYFYKIMPPNELDSIWFGKKDNIYFGHIFLIGIQRLRLFGKLNGFRINRIIPTKVNYSALLLLIVFYPFIILFCSLGYLRALKKQKHPKKLSIYEEIFKFNLNLNILVGNHLFVEFIKEMEEKEVVQSLNLIEDKKIDCT